MPARRTPWANTLRITGPIFVHHAPRIKLSQISGYGTVWATAWLATAGGRGGYPSMQIIPSARGSSGVRDATRATRPSFSAAPRVGRACREKRERRRVCWTRAVTAALRDAAQAPREGRARGRTQLSAVGDGYSARHLTVLEGLDAVRKRPGMYIGSTDDRGLSHCLWEIIDNSVDEALHGTCTKIEVILRADHSAEVRDNGRGIPVDIEPKTGLTGVELVMTRLHAGGKFGGGSYTASGGLHGVGASVVNALSARLDIEVDREGRTWAASFRRGVTGEFAAGGPDAEFARRSGLRQVARVGKNRTGTRIRFWPDRQVFLRDAAFGFDSLAERARQTAYLVPGLTIVIRAEGSDANGDAPAAMSREAEFRFAGGISEFCHHLATSEPVTDVIRLTGDGTFTETVPVIDDRGHMTPTEVERTLDVDVAICWGTGYD